MKNIEDTLNTSILPVNTFPVLERLRVVLKELGTNSLMNGVAHRDSRVKRLVWLINMQFHGEMATIDQYQEYQDISKQRDLEQQQMNEDSELESRIEDSYMSDLDIMFG